MKQSGCTGIALALTMLISGNSIGHENDASLDSPYLGQQTPGATAQLFAPGLVSISGRYEHGISFSPDLREIYFSANLKDGKTSVYYSRVQDNQWTPIRKADFTKGIKEEEMHPFVTLDGSKIYFTGLSSDLTDTKIWYVDRLDHAWGEAVKLASPVNSDQVFYPNLSAGGDLFYTNVSERSMYYSPADDGSFPAPQAVNIEFGFHGFIAPDKSYLLVNARNKDSQDRNDHDIYVYFAQPDGNWSEPINLGPAVNSHFDETVPSITPDGKYLFFSRYDEQGGQSNFYWVSTKAIKALK